MVVPPRSNRISRVPPYSRTKMLSTGTGLSPTMADLSKSFPFLHPGHWPGPRSLATTNGVSVDVLSSRYLDVSVPWVRLKPPILFGSLIPSLDNWKSKTSRLGLKHCCSNPKIRDLGVPAIEGGFPHSEIRGSKLLRSSPRLIAA